MWVNNGKVKTLIYKRSQINTKLDRMLLIFVLSFLGTPITKQRIRVEADYTTAAGPIFLNT